MGGKISEGEKLLVICTAIAGIVIWSIFNHLGYVFEF